MAKWKPKEYTAEERAEYGRMKREEEHQRQMAGVLKWERRVEPAPLEGTPAQIDYARAIREESLNPIVGGGMSFKASLFDGTHDNEAPFIGWLRGWLAPVLNEGSAKFWLDNKKSVRFPDVRDLLEHWDEISPRLPGIAAPVVKPKIELPAVLKDIRDKSPEGSTWNGKFYGRPGSWRIYVGNGRDNPEWRLSDAEKESIDKYLADKAAAASSGGTSKSAGFRGGAIADTTDYSTVVYPAPSPLGYQPDAVFVPFGQPDESSAKGGDASTVRFKVGGRYDSISPEQSEWAKSFFIEVKQPSRFYAGGLNTLEVLVDVYAKSPDGHGTRLIDGDKWYQGRVADGAEVLYASGSSLTFSADVPYTEAAPSPAESAPVEDNFRLKSESDEIEDFELEDSVLPPTRGSGGGRAPKLKEKNNFNQLAFDF